ncbi:protease PrsW [Agromyces luteolus]|uniref:PrsW family intramembrane metalloprotease n=1 Tax=Agromyces luteolus TaxID=88373 RepID=A0A7C9HGU1_9MICO|nr:PrsW family intramembrane metalloprotease [Agromyces luteolus]MUN06561.1 PrsW family intramembrane metalloprotease [Agromyces luteolus]GLK29274.1 protease PrsW [Agromyces luteolus]
MSLTPPPPADPYGHLNPAGPPSGDPAFSHRTAGRARSGLGAGAAIVVLIAVAGLVALLVAGYLAVSLGVSVVAVGTLVALVPLGIVLFAIRWIDRWEPEPRWALWLAFLWGAAVSVAIALIVDLGVQLFAAFASPDGASTDEALQAVVQAPIVEEVAKGAGVLLIYLLARSHFDGPVDGLVYGATVAAGFAFTENILYFGVALIEGGAGELGTTFIVRGLFSPFAHVLFTACTGVAIGFAARRGRGAGVMAWFLVGLGAAILLHAFWNGSLAFADAFALYFTVQVPIFIAAIVVTVLLRREEQRMTRARLSEYADAGWFNRDEVEGLSTWPGRRAALAWARAQHPPRTAQVQRFIADATRLAFTRNIIATGRADVRRHADERALLEAVTRDRAAISA